MGLFRLLFRAFRREVRRSSYVDQSLYRPVERPRPRVTQSVTVVETIEIVETTILAGPCWVVGGDTIRIQNKSIRIAGIDAPELNHPYGQNAKRALMQMCKGRTVSAHLHPDSSYDRLVATCYLDDGRDIAAELVKAGLALDWPKFSRGKYRHLEVEGARKKLWRIDAKQKGRLAPDKT